MASKFSGTWEDPRGFKAVITETGEGKVSVVYPDVPRGPFEGTETDPRIAPAFVIVSFSDVPEVIMGTIQNAGKVIIWGNNTVWLRTS